jgi:hypothetical protein
LAERTTARTPPPRCRDRPRVATPLTDQRISRRIDYWTTGLAKVEAVFLHQASILQQTDCALAPGSNWLNIAVDELDKDSCYLYILNYGKSIDFK